MARRRNGQKFRDAFDDSQNHRSQRIRHHDLELRHEFEKLDEPTPTLFPQSSFTALSAVHSCERYRPKKAGFFSPIRKAAATSKNVKTVSVPVLTFVSCCS